ncbi:(2Fe-2S)-binding protein [Sporosalibacterium faouarense]|uniref:(2Fe-2S)-binding protein n=1 Tax=Sporosalibacterium faouarense TaxID=516123 RepID=UPI00141CA1C2|nr:2Fe-2S iron-sulfur cluster-binding protein [Sporosalibacterium faouarense]MTI48262.1 2Fe-2S iron-sulfur cluster binding domain-containing protein [Bacillota bacterium]
MKINVKINGIKKALDVSPDEYLVETLRNNGYMSLRKGCDTGSCGMCTIHLDGEAVLSCVLISAKADGHEITTIEGVQEEAKDVAKYLVDEGVDQCGFCGTGTIMSILYLEKCVDNPTDEDILHYLRGNLCRCTGYAGQLRAIKRYLEAKNDEGSK